jgi:hypothetical protein
MDYALKYRSIFSGNTEEDSDKTVPQTDAGIAAFRVRNFRCEIRRSLPFLSVLKCLQSSALQTLKDYTVVNNEWQTFYFVLNCTDIVECYVLQFSR